MSDEHTRIILVMRHAERPDTPADRNLSPLGIKRAQRLVSYIPETFGKPDLIVAAAVSKNSERPFQTVEPLASSLSMKVQTPFADDQYAQLVDRIRNDGAYDVPRSVVCWHHGKIPQLMQALGAPAGQYPSRWVETVFNLILVTTLAASGEVTVSQVLEPF